MQLFASRARSTAKRMVAQYGKSMTLKRGVEGVYDPSTGNAAIAETSLPFKGVVDKPSFALLANGLAQVGDISVIIAAADDGLKGVAPEASDVVVIDGKTWRVMSVATTFAGEEYVLYTILARS